MAEEAGSSGTNIPTTEEAGTSRTNIPATTRAHRSAVHTYYEPVELQHPTTKKQVQGSLCNLCKSTFIHRIATNLKGHLKSKHPEAFDQVVRK